MDTDTLPDYCNLECSQKGSRDPKAGRNPKVSRKKKRGGKKKSGLTAKSRLQHEKEYHCIYTVFTTDSEPLVVRAAAQRPDKRSPYQCCFPQCNNFTSARLGMDQFNKHFSSTHQVDLKHLTRTDSDDFSTFEGWDCGDWEITPTNQLAPTSSDLPADMMDIDEGLVVHSQPTPPSMDIDNLDEGIVEPDVDAPTPPIAAGAPDHGLDMLDQEIINCHRSVIARIATSQSAQDSSSDPHPPEGLQSSAEDRIIYDINWDEDGTVNRNDHDHTNFQDDCPFKVRELGNTGARILICMLCQSAINPATIKNHLRNHRDKDDKPVVLSSQTQQWIGTLECDETLATKTQTVPTQKTGICWPPVEGLPIHQDGYQCTICAKCFRSKESLSNCRRSHGEQPSDPSTIKCLSVQQVFNKYIAVDTDLADASPATQLYIMLEYTSKVEALSSSAPPIDSLETPPWVQETGWLGILGPFLTNGPASLHGLVSPPFSDKQSPYTSPLRRMIEAYMGAVRQLTLGLHPIIFEMRQYVQAVPIKGRSLAWKVLQSKSLPTYALLLHKVVYTILVLRQNQGDDANHPKFFYGTNTKDTDASATSRSYITLPPRLEEAADALWTILEKTSQVGHNYSSDELENTADLDKDQDFEDDDDDPLAVEYELSKKLEYSSDEEDSVLQDTITTLRGSADIQALHAVIRCILLRQEHDGFRRESADTFMERWIALYNLLPDGSFRPTNNCTQSLAIICYHIRSAILVEALISPLPLGKSRLEMVKKLAIDNIGKDSGSPFQICRNYQTLATTITMNPRGPPPFLISEDCSRISYRGRTLDFPAFGAAVRSLLSATKKDLDDLLLDVENNQRLRSVDLPDVWSNTQAGYSWVTAFLETTLVDVDNLNTPPAVPQDALIKVLEPTVKWRNTHLVDGGVVSQHLGRCTRICKNLALLVFLTMGKPPPVSDMVEFLFSNSPTTHRNMFSSDGYFWLVSRQSPSPGVVGRSDALTAYKLSASVTDLLRKYFLFVRPAEIWLYSQVNHTAENIEEAHRLCSTTTWIDSNKMQKLKHEELSQLVTDFFLQENLHQQHIGPLIYTQLHTEVLRNYCEQQTAKIDANAEQAGHSLGMARTNYAIESDQLPGMPSDRLLEFGHKSEMWWGELLQLDIDEPQPCIPLHLKSRNEAEKKMAMNRKLDKVKEILTTGLPTVPVAQHK